MNVFIPPATAPRRDVLDVALVVISIIVTAWLVISVVGAVIALDRHYGYQDRV